MNQTKHEAHPNEMKEHVQDHNTKSSPKKQANIQRKLIPLQQNKTKAGEQEKSNTKRPQSDIIT